MILFTEEGQQNVKISPPHVSSSALQWSLFGAILSVVEAYWGGGVEWEGWESFDVMLTDLLSEYSTAGGVWYYV